MSRQLWKKHMNYACVFLCWTGAASESYVYVSQKTQTGHLLTIGCGTWFFYARKGLQELGHARRLGFRVLGSGLRDFVPNIGTPHDSNLGLGPEVLNLKPLNFSGNLKPRRIAKMREVRFWLHGQPDERSYYSLASNMACCLVARSSTYHQSVLYWIDLT